MNDKSYLIVGGDKRQEFLFNILQSKNFMVDKIFLNNHEDLSKSIDKLRNADVIILPIPSTKDSSTLYAPKFNKTIPLEMIIDNIPNKATVFIGGKKELFENTKAKKIIDLLSDESLTLKNAMATAEATLSIIITNTEKTIYNSKILVMGYGRIGKILSEYLSALKGKVCVFARREASRTQAELFGLHSVSCEDLMDELKKYDIIINTIPEVVFKKEELEKINTKTLIIDLASKPGGIDYNIAEKLKLKTIHALGLPGEYSPKSAAEYIESTIQKEIT